MNDTGNIIGVKALHGGVMSLEQRIEILEELLLVKPPTEMPSPAVIEPTLKTDIQIEEIDNRLETMGQKIETMDSDLGDFKSNIEDLDSELCDAKIILDDLEETGISGEQLTDRIKHYLRTYLRNSLGLEVSFDDKRQA